MKNTQAQTRGIARRGQPFDLSSGCAFKKVARWNGSAGQRRVKCAWFKPLKRQAQVPNAKNFAGRNILSRDRHNELYYNRCFQSRCRLRFTETEWPKLSDLNCLTWQGH